MLSYRSVQLPLTSYRGAYRHETHGGGSKHSCSPTQLVTATLIRIHFGCEQRNANHQQLAPVYFGPRSPHGASFHCGCALVTRLLLGATLVGDDMEPVIQEDTSGCGIAASAALAGVNYAEAKRRANALGIYAEDTSLWSETAHMRKLLSHFGISVSAEEKAFTSWERPPDKALLAIKWHVERGNPRWHWAVFIREGGEAKVLDSKKALRTNVRRDFGRIKPSGASKSVANPLWPAVPSSLPSNNQQSPPLVSHGLAFGCW